MATGAGRKNGVPGRAPKVRMTMEEARLAVHRLYHPKVDETEGLDWKAVLGERLPGCVLFGTMAIENDLLRRTVSEEPRRTIGWAFVVHPEGGPSYSLPGFEIRSYAGRSALDGDVVDGPIVRPSRARMLLENLRAVRRKSGPPPIVGRRGVSNALIDHERDWGPLVDLMAEAERLAPKLGATRELEVMRTLVRLHAQAMPDRFAKPVPQSRMAWGTG